MKYQECMPIRPELLTVWLIELPNGNRLVQIWCKDAAVEDVHHHVSLSYNKFRLSVCGVGCWKVEGIADMAYSPDARQVDQDWNVSLTTER